MSQLARWVRAHPANVVVVPMNVVRVVSLHEMFAIGTEGLGACSAIVIASSHGAIVAHIPPRPTASASDPYAGDNNVRRLMAEATTLYMRYRDEYFASHTDTVIVCALYQGAIALPDQVQIMHSALRRLGPSVWTYNVPGNIPIRDKELCSPSVAAGSPPLGFSMMVALGYTPDQQLLQM
ncbi:hypothetical protein BDQ94DRAFT_173467 [Aspergillus welwitschiae]|uniref:Uncharacterized protein n=1 Tax=Aspergillus welwitschiae TaxID=1341132 RepID=A0A3F3PSU4_9EURO|nr:hypothetical protein BDQ94DRAFT_173467 [Aspergillus welwitschiae]RDH29979.1 hypothetical protein BDQ94DRAFT_173467 [Aspergillus welwitschiae]GLA19132.1 hypothetical protein AnigIFM62618_006795 [Aspergillus niger]